MMKAYQMKSGGKKMVASNQRYKNHWYPSFPVRILSMLALTTLVLMARPQRVDTAVSFDYVPNPEFVETPAEQNVTSYLDQTTRLPCTVRYLGTKRVSWIRGRDLQVLSSGRTTFASDIRISILPGLRYSKRYKRYIQFDINYDNYLPNKGVYRRKIRSPAIQSRLQYYDGKNFSSLPTSKWIYIERKTPDDTKDAYQSYSGYERQKSKEYNIRLHRNNDIYAPLENKYIKITNEDGNTETIVATTLQSPVLIHSFSADRTAPSQRRTVVPSNYLDEIWDPEDFTLQIKYTKPSDAGTYICQINTEPRMSQIIRLKVIDMVAKLAGQKELFVREGSPVLLFCTVIHGVNLPGFIFWFKNDQLVDYESSEGRIKIETTQKGQSKLMLTHAIREDSANYTCVPSGGKADSTILTVIIDERPAAMQKGEAPSGGSCNFSLMMYVLYLSIAGICESTLVN